MGIFVAWKRPKKLKQGANPHIMRPKKVILCVDDNEQELSVLKFMLATNGYRVLSASNGQEAIAIFASASQIDLVLTDTNMPQMSGGQLVERLKRMAGHVPMILLSDVQAGAPYASGEIHAADALLTRKNCSSQELLERIKVMSARKRGPRKGAQRMPQVAELAAAS
jgi:two-component system, OmpR family, response regulator CpxR